MKRKHFLVVALALGLAAAPLAQQAPPAFHPGKVGLSVGPTLYVGPDILYGNEALQENVTKIGFGVQGHLAFALGTEYVYGRAVVGLHNIGTDASDIDDGDNPFLSNPLLALEANIAANFIAPSLSRTVPYAFAGFGGMFADPFGNDDLAGALERKKSALYIPMGLGVDFQVGPTISLFAEGSYRLLLEGVGEGTGEDFTTRFNPFAGLVGVAVGFGGSAPEPPPPPPPPLEPEPAPEPVPETCDVAELNTVYFASGSAALDERTRSLLDENVDKLLEQPACNVFIEGYTDSSEGEEFGTGLAGQRVERVADYYLLAGISEARMQLRNRGVAVPDCSKEDPGPGCARNRFVESIPFEEGDR